jgi:hypothetical protein
MLASTREPHFSFLDYPLPGQTAELIGTREVRIADAGGKVIAQRLDPRAAFHGLRRQYRWDDLDGLRVPTRRRVLPLLLGDRPLPGPTLVAIEVHELRGVTGK